LSDTAIKVEGLGKNYIIGHKKQGDFRNSVGDKLKGIFRPDASEKEIFWALKDINFEIKHGEAVGIIGRNGAGKSTLLKILSRITDPSTGRFEINGRVSSLLEVGTGFHMELTGRENIYLNGTILGMKRAEIRQKFDEIVEFSGVEKFLDTPVKHYSSGMKVRLAFSVAAHLEPEILIVDEVLAVGDAEFQKKCLGKMDQVSKNEGRTVLFVSHNMGAVEGLCQKGITLNNGEITYNGTSSEAINHYLNTSGEAKKFKYFDGLIDSVALYCNGINTSDILSGSRFEIIVTFSSDIDFDNLVLGIACYNLKGERLFGFNNKVIGKTLNDDIVSKGEIKITIPKFNLNEEGKCYLNLHLGNVNEDLEILDSKVVFNVIPTDIYNSGKIVPLKWGKVLFEGIQYKFNEL